MTESETIARTKGGPVTVESLQRDLAAMGVQEGMVLLVHSSLSALGWVCGGPVAVIQALEGVLGETGTLVMPAHSGDLSDPALWSHPPVPQEWWPTIRETMPAFESDLTPTRAMGAIAETFRRRRGALRSNHPHDSFVARGPHAEFITGNHSLDFGVGESSPLARIYDLNGWVLLLGVGHGNNTSLHLAEYRAAYPSRRIIEQGAPVWVDGVRKWMTFQDLDMDDGDFVALGAAFEAETGVQHRGRVGMGEALLMLQRELVDYGVSWIETNRS